MSMFDKVVAAVTPEASDEERAQAREQAREMAGTTWLALVIAHHEQIEQAFASVRSASATSERRTAQTLLCKLLTGHSIAEEAVLYPAMALTDQEMHSGTAYTEQSAAKVQAAALETLDPASHDYLEKLEHLRAAVMHHVYEEESKWFPQLLRDAGSADAERLTMRYEEEFSRYMGQGPTSGMSGGMNQGNHQSMGLDSGNVVAPMQSTLAAA